MGKRFPALIDVTRLAARLLKGEHPTGVDRVSLAYIQHYRDNARALVRHRGRWLRLNARPSRRVFEALLGEDSKPVFTLRANVAPAHLLNGTACGDCLFLNTGHSGLEYKGYADALRRQRVRPAYFLHDLIPLTHPEYSRPLEDQKHHRRLTTMLETGLGLVLNSEATRKDLLAYAERHGRALPELVVAPLGFEPLPEPSRQAPLNEPYFVMLGTVEPRKNHLLMLHVWHRFAERGLKPLPKLVLIGQRGWECEQVIDLLERCAALQEHVIELPSCDDEALSTWLAHARALLFPSFVEGFGLPLVEALSLGTPVIASDLVVFRENAGWIPEYIDPLDGPGWQAMIQAYVEPDSPQRRAQLERMRHFKRWSWDDHFGLVDGYLERWLKT